MPGKVTYQLYRLFWDGLDWLYPPRCGGCGAPGARWCAKCADSLQRIQFPVCPVCGQEQASDQLCPRCQAAPPAWDHLRSLARYGGALRHAIHALKYRRDLGLGEVLSRSLLQLYRSLAWQADMAVPVPLDLARMRERGYNQISLLTIPLALASELLYRPKALNKVKETPRQVTLNGHHRRSNLAGAFEADPQLVKGKTILLIDDVVTTGTTLQACSQALRTAGARQVFALTLARAGYSVDHTGREQHEDSWVNQ